LFLPLSPSPRLVDEGGGGGGSGSGGGGGGGLLPVHGGFSCRCQDACC